MSNFSSPGLSLDSAVFTRHPMKHGFDAPFVASAGASITYRMRAKANPGPGVVLWVVRGSPDFAGASAPAPIQPGTAVVDASWTS